MSDPITANECRAAQAMCAAERRAEIAAVREMVQTMDRERSGNRVRFDTLISDVAEIKKLTAEIRKEAGELYAIKMVEKVVFGLVGLVCVAVITAIIKLVLVP